MKSYLIMVPFILMIFIYSVYYHVYSVQNIELNNSAVNALYSATELGSIRTYRLDSINEEELFYQLISQSAQEFDYGYDSEIKIKLISQNPYMIEVTLNQYLGEDITEISRIFVMDARE